MPCGRLSKLHSIQRLPNTTVHVRVYICDTVLRDWVPSVFEVQPHWPCIGAIWQTAASCSLATSSRHIPSFAQILGSCFYPSTDTAWHRAMDPATFKAMDPSALPQTPPKDIFKPIDPTAMQSPPMTAGSGTPDGNTPQVVRQWSSSWRKITYSIWWNVCMHLI